MLSLLPTLCLVFLAHLRVTHAVQLSDIFNLPRYVYYPTDIRTFRDGTAVFAGSTSASVSTLSLSPFVKVPPNPPRNSETRVLARFHPENRTVIWAAAVVKIEGSVNIAVDPSGNTYVTGRLGSSFTKSTGSPFVLIKYGPRGNIIWTPEYSNRGTRAENAKNGFWLDAVRGRAVEYTRGRLVLSGTRPALDPRGILLALVIRPRDGKLLAVRPLRAPKAPLSPEKYAFAASGGVACFAAKQQLPNPEVNTSNLTKADVERLFVDRFFVQCRRLAGGKAVTRVLNLAGIKLDSVEMGMIPGKDGRSPQVWVVYASERDSEKVHEIAVYRMDAKTLNDIDWKTGKSTGSRGTGLTINFSTPGELGQAGRVFSVEFSSTTDRLVVGYASTARIKRIVQRRGKISIRGSRSYSIPSLIYMMFFDSSQRLIVKAIPDDPRRGEVDDDFNHFLVTGATLTPDERKTFLFGALQKIRRGRYLAEFKSGPFYVHPVRIPHVQE